MLRLYVISKHIRFNVPERFARPWLNGGIPLSLKTFPVVVEDGLKP